MQDELTKQSARVFYHVILTFQSGINFGVIKSNKRSLSFAKTTTSPTVGPGSYDTTLSTSRKINNPTIPRHNLNNSSTGPSTRRVKNNGSIKGNFEFDSEDSDD